MAAVKLDFSFKSTVWLSSFIALVSVNMGGSKNCDEFKELILFLTIRQKYSYSN